MKCPHCEKSIIGNLRAEVKEASLPSGYNYSSVKTLIVCCPSCAAVIGATVEPIALKADIVNALKRG